MSDSENFTLVPCPVCKRTFKSDIVERHKKTCQTLATKKRKLFDSGKQRLGGTGASLDKRIKPGEKLPKPATDPKIIAAEKRKNNWRIKHEQFISTLQANRNAAKNPNAPVAPSPIDPSLVQCPYCSRRFNENAADRHIPLCKEKVSRGAPVASRKTPSATSTSSKVSSAGSSASSVSRMKKPIVSASSVRSVDSHVSTSSSSQRISSSKKTLPASRTNSGVKVSRTTEADEKSVSLNLLKMTIEEKKGGDCAVPAARSHQRRRSLSRRQVPVTIPKNVRTLMNL